MKTALIALLAAVPWGALAQAPRIEADAGVATMLGIAQAELRRSAPGTLAVPVLVNGTAKALARLCNGEVAIAGAARAAAKAERDACARNKVAFVELPVATDAVLVVVNPANGWAKQVDLAQLGRAWLDAPGKASSWRQVNAAWPEMPLKLYGPGPSLGLAGVTHAALVAGAPRPAPEMRRDVTSTEVLNVVIEGVARDRAALGLVDRATYEANRKRVRLVPVTGDGALVFPLYVYASVAALQDAGVRAWLDRLLAGGARFAAQAGLGPLPPEAYQRARQQLAAGRTP